MFSQDWKRGLLPALLLPILVACQPNNASADTPAKASRTSSAVSALPKMVVHKDANCGCCGAYVDYLRKHGATVEVVTEPNMTAVRQRFGTDKLASCHTIEVGNYVVEGHVPISAIQKLVREQPKIKGIALPGMPLHSPGMGEEKKGSLQIVTIGKQGENSGIFSVE